MVTASQINGRMSHRTPLWRVLWNASLVQLAAGLLLLIAVLTGTGGLPAIFVCVMAYMAGQGFVFPNCSAIAMMRHGEIAGTASALLGTNQFLIAALAATFLGLLENPAVPMAIVIATCAGVAALLNFLTLSKRLEIAPQAA